MAYYSRYNCSTWTTKLVIRDNNITTITRHVRMNLPRCKVLAEKGERPHKPLIDLVQCQLLLRRLENCLQRVKETLHEA